MEDQIQHIENIEDCFEHNNELIARWSDSRKKKSTQTTYKFISKFNNSSPFPITNNIILNSTSTWTCMPQFFYWNPLSKNWRNNYRTKKLVQ